MSEIFNNYFDNRELSWLKFNKRVLEEAEDKSVPLLERLGFVYIFSNNLDEFFMVRVGTLHDQSLIKSAKTDNKTLLTASAQLERIAREVSLLLPRKDKAYADIMDELNAHGIEHAGFESLPEKDLLYLEEYFRHELLPLLSPTILDKNHPLPFLRNKELYVCVILKKKKSDGEKILSGILPVATGVASERIILLPQDDEKIRFVLLEELVEYFSDLAFPNMTVTHKTICRVTRNADIDVNEALFDHDVDFRDIMEELIKKRKKLAPIRIETTSLNEYIGKSELAELMGLELGEDFVFSQSCPLDMGFVSALCDKLKPLKPELFFAPLKPQPSTSLSLNESIIRQIEKNDVLLTYPYEEFRPFIKLLEEAADDPTVVSVKITLYRVARDSKIINALIRAAENGKDVLALVELRARFDEENNIGWSKRLAEAGVTVIYGLDEMKVHSKLMLITKKNGNDINYITQVGTGNYNERTSKLYTDITLMTANRDFGTDASLIFNNLSVGTPVESSSTLLVAPNCLKSRVVEMIDREITFGENGYIGLKLNSLTDFDIIQKLVQANQKGVKIDLIVRGICCLVAGIKGYTENIRVISIVGRFLEHSRIYIFGKEEREKVYISSADFMTRNTERRVEVAAPIKNPIIKARLVVIFNMMLADNVKARLQLPDGTYEKLTATGDKEPLDTQLYFYKAAYRNAEQLATDKKKKKGIASRLKALLKK